MHLGCTLGVGLGCTGVLECILRVHFGVQGAMWDGFRVNWSACRMQGCMGAIRVFGVFWGAFWVHLGVAFGVRGSPCVKKHYWKNQGCNSNKEQQYQFKQSFYQIFVQKKTKITKDRK